MKTAGTAKSQRAGTCSADKTLWLLNNGENPHSVQAGDTTQTPHSFLSMGVPLGIPPVPYRDPHTTPVGPNAALLVQADATLVEVMVFPIISSLDKCQSLSHDILAG